MYDKCFCCVLCLVVHLETEDFPENVKRIYQEQGLGNKTFDSISACLFSGEVVKEVNHSNIMWWLIIQYMPKFTRDINDLFGTIFTYNSVTNITADVQLYQESLSCQNAKDYRSLAYYVYLDYFVKLVFIKGTETGQITTVLLIS